MSIEVIRDLRGLHSSIARHRNGPLNTAASLAIVPTMGAIHKAHEALVIEAKRNANIVLATIFVNPMQFGENEDLDKYPKSELEDIKRLESAGCDIVYIPKNETMYPENFDLTINVPELSSVLCGKDRKNHFQGVATVVAKLLLQSGADYAVFGEKDYQQVYLDDIIQIMELPEEAPGLVDITIEPVEDDSYVHISSSEIEENLAGIVGELSVYDPDSSLPPNSTSTSEEIVDYFYFGGENDLSVLPYTGNYILQISEDYGDGLNGGDSMV